MYVLVDLAIDAVELVDPEATHDFSMVVANGTGVDRVGELLASSGAGRLIDEGEEGEPDHAWISAGWLRGAAAGRVHASWEDHLVKMLDKARSHGWLSDDGDLVRAHISWPDEEEPGA